MINFSLSEDQELARETFHSAARDVLRPAGRPSEEAASIDAALLAQTRELGLRDVQDAESRDPVLNAVVLEELGWGDPSLALAITGTIAFIQAVNGSGTEAQKSLVADLERSGAAAAVAIAEPGFNFDTTEMATSAIEENDAYVLNGKKAFIPLGKECAYFLVFATEGEAQQAFIVSRDTPGVSVEPVKTLGLGALGLAHVKLSDVRVDRDMRLGGSNGCDTQRIIDTCRTGTAAVLNGTARAVYEYVKDYTRERVAHGSALAQKQTVGFRLVDMHIAVESMRWMNWRAASELASGAETATRSARLAHIYACEQANWIADEGVQLLGGHGFLRDHPVEHWFRATRTLSNLEGLASV